MKNSKNRALSISVLVCAIAMVAVCIFPVSAWEYPGGEHDSLFESYGPRVDSMLIKTYTSEITEWETGLEGGQIDITDWPLDQQRLDRYTTAPWNNTLKVYGYGAEFGAYYFDLNNNNNTYLGNPPNPAYPNPRWPNPLGYTVSESGVIHDNGYPLRHAIAHLVDRSVVVSEVGAGAAVPIYTPVPPSFGKYSHPDIKPGGAREDLTHPHSAVVASQILNGSGMFPFGVDGWRYWDRNRNSVKDSGEDLVLKIVARIDHAPRYRMGQELAAELSGAGVRIRTDVRYFTVSAERLQWMSNKDAHISTAGWSLSSTPDFLTLWHWKYYWHPGRSYNTGGCNKDAFNNAADGVQYANTQDDAVSNARTAQEVFCDAILGIPVFSNSGYKAMSRTYVGGEEQNGEDWYGMVNWGGYGIDNAYSFMNMHTSDHEYGGRIRYGLKTSDIRQLNPLFSEWLWDNMVLDLIGYEGLVARDPYTMEYVPWVAKSFSIGTYKHAIYGTCTKVVFTLRNDVYFQDGHQLTIEDVYFTYLEAADILYSRGIAPPWWINNVQNILSFSILDPLSFEVLLNVKSIFAIGWIGGNRILPRHIWEPICKGAIAPKSGLPWDSTSFAPDPNLIGSGAWRLDEYVGTDHILLQANKPGSTVDTGISDSNANSQPVTSAYGFFRLKPEYVNIHADAYKAKIDPGFPKTWALVNLTVVSQNLKMEEFEFEFAGDYAHPVGGKMLLRWPMNVGCEWTVLDWIDETSNGMLDAGDMVKVQPTNPWGARTIWLNVKAVKSGNMLRVGQVIESDKYVYFSGNKLIGPVHEYEKPCTPTTETFQMNLTKGFYVAKAAKYITTTWFLCPNNNLAANPYVGWINVTWPIWLTLPEDITGSYYGSSWLLAPDLKVDLKDVFVAGKAFGSVPGDPKWNTLADTNHDYKVDLKDYFGIAKRFGKW
jgi:peptide/nickel transport system substrate-binding protein